MRAKFIYEKFTTDSDPIDDLQIGMMHQIEKFVKSIRPASINDYLPICAEYGKTNYVKYLLEMGADVHVYDDAPLMWACFNGYADVVKVLLDYGAKAHARDDAPLRLAKDYGRADVVRVLKDWITKEKGQKKIKESLNEKFIENSDPIHDMGIGYTPEKIVKDFRKRMHEEFSDFQDSDEYNFYFDEEFNYMKISLWPYSDAGMNNLDAAVKKIIRKYFKRKLVYINEMNWEKENMPEELYDEENIFIKIKI